MLRTFSTNGNFKAETLTRLPDAVRKCADISLVHSVSDGKRRWETSDRHVYVVLNKAQKRVYTIEDIDGNMLPAVIERTKESIPTFVNSVSLQRGIVAAGFEEYFKTKRISWL
jgi:hypothetical protein